MREPDRGIDAPARRAHGLGLFTRAQRVLEDEARELLPRAPVAADGARGLGVDAERQERIVFKRYPWPPPTSMITLNPLKSTLAATAFAVPMEKLVIAALKISHSSLFSAAWNQVNTSVPNACCGPLSPVRNTSSSLPQGSQCERAVIMMAMRRMLPGTSERNRSETGVSE
jgi:hypothetical protein